MDSMLEKKAWGKGYVTNPFSYLNEDITSFSDRDLTALKECFLFHYRKYEKFKKTNESLGIPSYAQRMPVLMEHKHGKKEEQLKLEMEQDELNYQVRNEINDLNKLKLDYWKEKSNSNKQMIGQTFTRK